MPRRWGYGEGGSHVAVDPFAGPSDGGPVYGLQEPIPRSAGVRNDRNADDEEEDNKDDENDDDEKDENDEQGQRRRTSARARTKKGAMHAGTLQWHSAIH
jgi:hypothetical protein